MLIRFVVACLITLLALLSPGAGLAEVRAAAPSAELQSTDDAPAGEPHWNEAAELRLVVEPATESAAWQPGNRPLSNASRMEQPARPDPLRYRAPLLSGIERPPRGSLLRA